MIVNCGSRATMFVPRRPPMSTVCLASKINTEQLRTQLNQLHSEAENTRAKANNARLRLMRLSEVAEKLQKRAAISIQSGRENDARELLFQKKKVMQALEKSKNRIKLLDELSVKLNQAIFLKETQLVENVASDVEVARDDGSRSVRIVPPKEEVVEHLNENKAFDLNALKLGEDEDLNENKEDFDQDALKNFENEEFLDHEGSQGDLTIGNDSDNLKGNLEGSSIRKTWSAANLLSGLNNVSSYKDFLEHLDQQLNNIEEELLTILRLSTLVLEGEEKPKNFRVQQTVEILEGVRQIRGRIACIMQTTLGII